MSKKNKNYLTTPTLDAYKLGFLHGLKESYDIIFISFARCCHSSIKCSVSSDVFVKFDNLLRLVRSTEPSCLYLAHNETITNPDILD